MDRVDEAVATAANIHGLCTTTSELRRLAELAHDAEFTVEVGSYMGRSSKALALATKGIVYCVDTWRGSEEDTDGEKTRETSPEVLYSSFIRNTWNEISTAKIIPLRCDSVEGAKIFKELGYTFDLLFLDAGHNYEWVTRDIQAWKPLIHEGGVIVGHDLPHPRMVDALNDYLPNWKPSVGMLWEWKNE